MKTMFSKWGRYILPLGIILAVTFSLFTLSGSASDVFPMASGVYYDTSMDSYTGCNIIVQVNGSNDSTHISAGDLVSVKVIPDQGYITTDLEFTFYNESYEYLFSLNWQEQSAEAQSHVTYHKDGSCTVSFVAPDQLNNAAFVFFTLSCNSGVLVEWIIPYGCAIENIVYGLPFYDLSSSVYSTSTLIPGAAFDLSQYSVNGEDGAIGSFSTESGIITYDPVATYDEDTDRLVIVVRDNTTLVQNVINSIITPITDFLGGIGQSFVQIFESLVVESDGSLTSLAIWALSFIGLGFAISCVYILFKRLT